MNPAAAIWSRAVGRHQLPTLIVIAARQKEPLSLYPYPSSFPGGVWCQFRSATAFSGFSNAKADHGWVGTHGGVGSGRDALIVSGLSDTFTTGRWRLWNTGAGARFAPRCCRKVLRPESTSTRTVGWPEVYRYWASRTTGGPTDFVPTSLQLMAKFELPTNVIVSPMIWVQLVRVPSPPANVMSPVGT